MRRNTETGGGGTSHKAPGRKTEMSSLQRCFLMSNVDYVHLRIEVWKQKCKGGVLSFRATLGVLPDLSVSVKPFPLQGCLAPPSHCVAMRCRWTLSLFVEWERAFKWFALCKVKLHICVPAEQCGSHHLTRRRGRSNHNLSYVKTLWNLPKPVCRLCKTTSIYTRCYVTITNWNCIDNIHHSQLDLPFGQAGFLQTHGVRWLSYQRQVCSRYKFAQS